MNENIIIIGPIGVGKSTVAPEVARRTDKKHIDMDELRSEIYSMTDYSNQKAEEAYSSGGVIEWYNYQKPYELFAVKTLLEQNQNSVIEFGGGQSIYSNDEQLTTFLNLMENQPFVFSLLPSESVNRSSEILNSRARFEDEKILNEIFLTSDCNKRVAKFTIYTEGKEPQETIEEILSLYQTNQN